MLLLCWTPCMLARRTPPGPLSTLVRAWTLISPPPWTLHTPTFEAEVSFTQRPTTCCLPRRAAFRIQLFYLLIIDCPVDQPLTCVWSSAEQSTRISVPSRWRSCITVSYQIESWASCTTHTQPILRSQTSWSWVTWKKIMRISKSSPMLRLWMLKSRTTLLPSAPNLCLRLQKVLFEIALSKSSTDLS